MQRQLLIINNIVCDLSDDKPIALTFQINDLATLSDRQSTFSQTVKLPKTATNKRALGYSDIDAFTGTEPYQYNTAKYIVNGVEVISYGQAVLNQISDYFEVVLTYGLSGLNNLIDGINISDLDYSIFTEYVNTPIRIASSQTETTGYLWPVIDFGQLEGESGSIDIRYLRRAFFTKSILYVIGKKTGYVISGNIFSDPLFLQELILNPTANINADTLGKNLPDIAIKDFLKDVMQRYFLTPEVDNYKKTLRFRSFDELYANIGMARDWTDKFIDDARTDNFILPNYAQTNNLKYKDLEGLAIDPNGSIAVANTTLPASVDLVTSLYTGTDSRTDRLAGNHVSYKNIKTDANDGTLNSADSIVLYNRVLGGGGEFFLFRQGPGSDPHEYSAHASVPYFDINSINGLPFNQMITRYGQGLLKLLNKCRVITRYAVLTEKDVTNFDFFIPVYDRREGKYYYVNQITNFIPGVKTKVQLIRM